MISDRRLYLAGDRRTVVEEGDPRAAFLLVAAGGTLTDDEARRFGYAGVADLLAGVEPPKPAAATPDDPTPRIPQTGPGLTITRRNRKK